MERGDSSQLGLLFFLLFFFLLTIHFVYIDDIFEIGNGLIGVKRNIFLRLISFLGIRKENKLREVWIVIMIEYYVVLYWYLISLLSFYFVSVYWDKRRNI
jgi:hypothetical protein